MEPKSDQWPLCATPTVRPGEWAGLSVLVVDRFATVLDVVRSVLSEGDYHASAVTAAADALVLLGARTFDLVIVDVPPLEAMSFVERVRSSSRREVATLPIVLVTLRFDAEIVDAAYEAGVTFLLPVPLTAVALAKIVRRLPPTLRPRSSETPTWRPMSASGRSSEPDTGGGTR